MLLLLVVLSGIVPSAQADPIYQGPLLFGMDPVVRYTRDPRLLGVDRLVLLRRLAVLGVDPYKYPDRKPGLESSFRRYFNERANFDLVRTEHIIEYNGNLGLMTEIRYPSFFYLFPSPETLPGGFLYYPPRPVGDPLVELFVDDLQTGAERRQAVDRIIVRTSSLDVSGLGRRTDQDGGLINLTIPIKLPRTLEKIIGRGEKTKIKITGRERIAITGESSVVNPFTPTERVSSQSLFPTLDMEQELQVNLSGTIGEKIIIEVDHNSAQIGPDATNIKLMYQGLEDEIIKTIETGDVGLTLPGSQLLGYNSNKSGLFGIKVTGQVGRADFTGVVTKQKAESSSKTFNATGGLVTDNVISSAEYINHRFFKLDLPQEEFPGGRVQGDIILEETIQIFQLMPTGEPTINDIVNVAVYVDSTGFRNWNGIDFENPILFGYRWREIPAASFDPMRDVDGNLIAVDLRSRMADQDALAVVYKIRQADGTISQVGDIPGVNTPTQTITGGDGVYYRMKLLKAPVTYEEPWSFQYVLRNIYPLGGSNIDPTTFRLRIERNQPGDNQPQQDETGLDYIRIFGLDQDNPQRTGVPDGLADTWDPYVIDLKAGLLKFPLDFPMPFAPGGQIFLPDGTVDQAADQAAEDAYAAYADTSTFVWDPSFLRTNQTWELYDPSVYPSRYGEYGRFLIVATHASAASNFNLGVSNIEEGSEVVTLDGRTLTPGVDYEIDYTFGEVKLLGEAANLTPDSNIAVTYSFAPFLGGGNTSLMGFNLGYDLGRDSKASTTWLYQSESIVGEKAKLGEEPSKNLVGNLNLQHTFRPYFLTDVANFLSRRNTERESQLQFNGEMAISLPNPNTKGKVYLEDFEGVDSSDVITLTRIGWFWSSVPILGQGGTSQNPDSRTFDPEDRVETIRWFLPKDRTLRRYLNPDLINQERDETQPSMDLYLRADDGVWDTDNWGGIMRGISRSGTDLSQAQFVEIWINDGVPDIDERRGRVHIDFGYINEDGFWPVSSDGQLVTGTRQQEDGIVPGTVPDGIFYAPDEDIGLAGNENGPQKFSAEYEINGDSPFPRINGTSRNGREDTEDLNGDDLLNTDNGFYTVTIDLQSTKPLVDVVYDYDDVQDLIDAGIAWRKYRIPMAAIDSVSTGTSPNLRAVTHTRIWYEDPNPGGRSALTLQLSEFQFLGSRWERQGIRRIDGEKLLTQSELLSGEEYFLGEVNNKENPDYVSPVPVETINNIPEKEQSLVLSFQNIEQGHMVRAAKQVSARGDDYTRYSDLGWYWYNPSHTTADLDLFFRVGTDTLNYYEIGYRFSESSIKTGWKFFDVNIAELSNAKNGVVDSEGVVHSTIQDVRSGEIYNVQVVGSPDLRQVKRYYFGFRNNDLSNPATGYFYMDDVLLEGVKRDSGTAERAGLRLSMADVIKVDFDWRHVDDEYHGLDKETGTGIDQEDWSLSTNLAVEDFIPLAGFRLPVSGSRRQLINRPKYEIHSDIEIIDEDVRNAESSIDTQERFSSRLSHAPSKGAIPRYLVDPWTLLLNGSRRKVEGPLERRFNKNLQGSLNYDLRIMGRYTLGAYPVLEYLPIVNRFSIVPKKIAFAGRFTSNYTTSQTINNNGVVTNQPTQVTRPGQITANMDYQPLPLVDMSISAASDRDLLREQFVWGINIGQENKRAYELRMTVLIPKSSALPGGKLFSPLRTFTKGVNNLRPSIQFNGSYVDDHGPGVRQPTDPPQMKSVSNAGRWELRLDVPLGDGFKSLFPERRYSQSDRDRLIAEQQRREQQNMRASGRRGQDPEGGVPAEGQDGRPPDEPQAIADEDIAGLTPEEIQRREEERLLEAAAAQEELDREMGLTREEETVSAEGGGFRPLSVLDPVLSSLRNTTPVKVVYTDQRASAYARLDGNTSFWYQAGLTGAIDAPDTAYSSSVEDIRQNLTLSTSTKLSKGVGLDLKYGQGETMRDQLGSVVRTYKQDWPDAQLSWSGLEKWRIFGGNSENIDSGLFRSSNFNISYKKSKVVNNITDSSYNPSIVKSWSPRWTMNFHSGMTATLNATFNNSNSIVNGASTLNNKMRLGLQLRHSLNAQSFLAKLGLYRPGSNQSVTMDIDLSYQTDRNERINPTGPPSKATGTNRLSLNPRFSYQITRNLSGAIRFIFGRSKNLASGQTTTNLGLGVEATFVF